MADRTIRMNTTAAGPEGTFLAGQVVSVDVATADAWIAGGYANPVGDGPAPAKAARAARARNPRAPAEGDQSEGGGDIGETSGEE